MKIIEGLKRIKDMQRKLDDLRSKIAQYCADMDVENPAYGTPEKQAQQIADWLQACHDIIAEIERLKICILKTNLATQVPVEMTTGTVATKPIAAWIYRRKGLADAEGAVWSALTNRGLKETPYKPGKDSEEVRVAKVRRYYDQKTRDAKVEEYTSEKFRVDAALEVANAITDLME